MRILPLFAELPIPRPYARATLLPPLNRDRQLGAPPLR